MKDIVVLKDKQGSVFTTSLLIADKFGKQHKNVIAKIESLSDSTIGRLKIKPTTYVDEQGKINKMYQLDRDAFAFIAMGFTGKKADEWKLAFLAAFNQMEEHLQKILDQRWLEHRTEAALEYKVMSDTLQEVRALAGKETKGWHYANEALLVNWALTGEFKKVDRAKLSADELRLLGVLERLNAVLLGAGFNRQQRQERLVERCRMIKQELLAA
jgi:Rha family phage regulatory protein